MKLAEKILNKHLDVTLFTSQHKKLKFWILLAMEEYAKESNKIEKTVSSDDSMISVKSKQTCENCKFWNEKNAECKNDVIWLNKDKDVFMNISDLKTGMKDFGCTRFEQKCYFCQHNDAENNLTH